MKPENWYIVITCLLILLALLIAEYGWSAEPVEPGIKKITREEAIRHLVTPKVKYKYRLPYYSKRIDAYKKEVYRSRLVKAFEKSAHEFNLPVNLLIAIGYRETVFRLDEVGPAGEVGIMQVMPWITKKKRAREYCRNLNTIEGSIRCGAWWLSRGRDRCGSVENGLNAYVSGKCNPTHPRARESAANRIWIWKYLDKMTGDDAVAVN